MDQNKSFPIVFETIKGNCQKPANNSSFYNLNEVAAVMRHVNKILKGKWNNRTIFCSNIGIISPYLAQTEIIRSECKKAGFERIKIGTAEVFQGSEKPIIIISTVRNGKNLGFVTDKLVRISMFF